MNGAFQAFEEGKCQGISIIPFKCITAYFHIIIIFTDLGIYRITCSYVLANFITLIYAYHAFEKHILLLSFEFDKSFCKRIALLSLPFATTGFLATIYYSIDSIIVTNMVGNYSTVSIMQHIK